MKNNNIAKKTMEVCSFIVVFNNPNTKRIMLSPGGHLIKELYDAPSQNT